MPDLSVPLVNEEAARRRQQQDAQQTGQIMQLANIALLTRRQQEADEDRFYRKNMAILGADWVPPEAKVQAANELLPKLGYKDYQVTIEGVAPFHKLLKGLEDDLKKGVDVSDRQGLIDYWASNPQFVTPRFAPAVAQAREQIQNKQAATAVELANPLPEPVQQAKDRVLGRSEELDQLMAQQDSFQDALNNTTASPVARRDALASLERLSALRQEDAQDRSILDGDTLRQKRNDQIAAFIKGKPGYVDAVAKIGLQESGFHALDDGFMKLRLHQLQAMPPEQRTEEDIRKMDSLTRLLGGTTTLRETTAANTAMLNARLRQAKTESQALATTKAADDTYVQQTRELTAPLDSLLTGLQANTIPADKWQSLQTEAQAHAEKMGQAKLDAVQAATPQVQAWMEDRQDLQQRADDLHRQAASAPSSRRATLLTEETKLRRVLEARDAQMDLFTKYHPLEGAEHQWNLTLHQQNVERLGAALKSGVNAEDRERLTQELDLSKQTVTQEETFLNTWRTGRQRALVTIQKVQLQQQKETMELEGKLTSAQRGLEKDEATNLLARAILTDVGEGKTITAALRANRDAFGSADVKKAVEIATDATKADTSTATAYAQDIFAGLVAGNKGELTPEKAAGLATQAVKAAKKQYGLTVSTDDVLKAMPSGKAFEGGGLSGAKDLQIMWQRVVTTAAQLSGNSGIQIGQGEGGAPEISIGSVKDPVKLAGMIETLMGGQAFLPPQVKQSLVATVTALRGKSLAPTPTPAAAPQPAPADRPAVPASASPAIGLEQRLREKYLKP